MSVIPASAYPNGFGPDDAEREGLSAAKAVDKEIGILLNYKREKLGREPTPEDLERWAAIYMRIGTKLQAFARMQRKAHDAATKAPRGRGRGRKPRAEKRDEVVDLDEVPADLGVEIE